MQFQKVEEAFILKIEKGEEVIETITRFCDEQSVVNATVSAIGAVDRISVGYYSLETKKYHFKQYDGMYEVLNATGNVILKDEKPFLHLHATFSDENNSAFGGHVESMRVGVVLEVFVKPLTSGISRTHDESIGLHLMDL